MLFWFGPTWAIVFYIVRALTEPHYRIRSYEMVEIVVTFFSTLIQAVVIHGLWLLFTRPKHIRGAVKN